MTAPAYSMIAYCGVNLLVAYSGWHQTTELPERHKQWKYNISAWKRWHYVMPVVMSPFAPISSIGGAHINKCLQFPAFVRVYTPYKIRIN